MYRDALNDLAGIMVRNGRMSFVAQKFVKRCAQSQSRHLRQSKDNLFVAHSLCNKVIDLRMSSEFCADVVLLSCRHVVMVFR